MDGRMTLDDLLREWADWSATDDPRIGYAPKSLGWSGACEEPSDEDAEIALEEVAEQRARLLDCLIDRLPPDEQAAVSNAYAARVWRLRDEAGALNRGLDRLKGVLQREGLLDR